jgi:exosortase J
MLQISFACSVLEEEIPSEVATERNSIPLQPGFGQRPRRRTWITIALMSAAGIFTLYPLFAPLWSMWMGDPLRSIGMFSPPVSLFLTLRVWRQEGWQLRGSWWGFPVFVASVVLSLLHTNNRLVAILRLGSLFGVGLIPAGLSFFLYGTGVILLFAGFRVWRKALFPLILLLLVNPLPTNAAMLLDMPLQRVSAQIARSFATVIHFAPSNTQLQLMFSPDFGMFIAPGCDGIRGAVTLGYIALILGYWKRLSPVRWASTVAGAVMLGYLFNLIRLCALVLYYRVALGHSWLESVAKQADYAIGGCLFPVASALFVMFVVLNKEPKAETIFALLPAPEIDKPRPIFGRATAFAFLVLVTVTLYGVQMAAQPRSSQAVFASHRLPDSFGSYQLNRTWTEKNGNVTALEDGAYTSRKTGHEVVLAVWIAPGFHNAQDCRLIRGLDPESRATRSFATLGKQMSFDTAYYNDGISDMILATAACTPSSCIAPSSTNARAWILFLPPDLGPLGGEKKHAVPFLVRVERPEGEASKNVTQQELKAELQNFMSEVDFLELSKNFQ